MVPSGGWRHGAWERPHRIRSDGIQNNHESLSRTKGDLAGQVRSGESILSNWAVRKKNPTGSLRRQDGSRQESGLGKTDNP